MKKKVLFLSYDGMTDPLGQSQVIPYLAGLAKHGYVISIISFEKPDKLNKSKTFIQSKLDKAGIQWHPLVFHTSPPKIAKWWDTQLMRKKAAALHKQEEFDIIHCRSYIAADVGLRLKRKTGVKLLFDMRGFWPDEKAEGGSWNKNNFFWKRVYRYYKKKEQQFILESDSLITLTDAAKKEIESWSFYNNKVPITVIPCCADDKLFSLTSPEQREESRKKMAIPADALLLGYLGSVGAWYMLDEMLVFFKQLKRKYPGAIFLFITNTDKSFFTGKLEKHGLSEERDIKIIQVNYTEVPQYIKAADISISFIRPVFSKKGSSPVKIGETLCMGIPLIANDIGDCGTIINECNAGFVIKEFSEAQYNIIINDIDKIKTLNSGTIRNKSLQYYGLEVGISKYLSVYQSLCA